MAAHTASPPHPPIHLPPPQLQSRSSVRSPSPSRIAVPDYQSIDPLLGNLSPEATLQVLTSADAVPTNERGAHDILARSISQVSPAERALGIRAAIAAQKLGQWYRELQAWQWPKGTDAHLGKGFVSPSVDSESAEQEYYGSLPAAVVAQHEKRIEEIRDELENLNVDELKEHVLNAHIPARSRPSSSNSTVSTPPPLSYVQLSDFTAVITATILRALPLLSRLNSLLSTWDVRLLVLRQIPGLRQGLRLARAELNSAMDLLKSNETPTETDPLYSRANYHVKRTALEGTVISAGRRMDRILDSLEGREDSLPEAWIDDLETIESEFGSWVMEAEKRSVQNEWRRTMTTKHQKGTTPEVEPIQTVSIHEESADAEDLVSTKFLSSDVARPHPMETIEEEPHSPLKTVATEVTGLDRSSIARPSIETTTSEVPVVVSSEGVELSTLDSPLDTKLDESETQVTTPSPVETEYPGTSKTKEDTPSSSEAGDSEPASYVREEADHAAHPQSTDLPAEGGSPLPDKSIEQPDSDSHNSVRSASAKHETSETEGETPHAGSPCHSLSAADEPLIPEPLLEPEQDTIPEKEFDMGESIPFQEIARPIEVETPKESSAPSPVNESPFHPSASSLNRSDTQLTTTEVAAAAPVYENDLSLSLSSPPWAHSSKSNLSDDQEKPVSSLSNTPGESDEPQLPKRPLESPIKLSKEVSARPNFEKDETRPHARRSSIASAASYSDYPSLISSPELHGPRTTTSTNETPLPLETPPQVRLKCEPTNPTPSNNHTLRADRLLGLDNDVTPPRTALKHNRALSLPLQRFINERLDLDYENENSANVESPTADKHPRDVSQPTRLSSRPASAPRSQKKNRPSAPPNNTRPHSPKQRIKPHLEGSPTVESEVQKPDRTNKWKHHETIGQERMSSHPHLEPPIHIAAVRLRRQLASHPSLEDIGGHKSFTEDSSVSSVVRNSSRPSSRSNRPKKPKDQMDEKISSILTTIPGNISLMQAEDSEQETSSVASFPLKSRELRSVSRSRTSSRSGTPGPGLTITPAPSRRRHSHAPGANEMKVYHLHGGDKPVKLACRTVGRNGERVMARIGGGWSDLAEYLTVYAMHHRSRHFADAPRVEVQELSSRESTPSYAPPATRVASGNGRNTPSRPQSVLSNRPPSSLAVRKARRSSNASDVTGFRTVSAGAALNSSGTPLSTVSSRRRLSVSSNTSAGAASSANYSPSTTIGGTSPTIPLGLAGPKPRSRRISMTPESEAWVEDVLGQARRSASLRPLPVTQDQESTGRRTPALAKSRSINDIGAAGSSRRVALRGLGNRLP
ncbi:hypothetical protein BJX96DRAFT_157940 [Aspergillus floccosus]